MIRTLGSFPILGCLLVFAFHIVRRSKKKFMAVLRCCARLGKKMSRKLASGCRFANTHGAMTWDMSGISLSALLFVPDRQPRSKNERCTTIRSNTGCARLSKLRKRKRAGCGGAWERSNATRIVGDSGVLEDSKRFMSFYITLTRRLHGAATIFSSYHCKTLSTPTFPKIRSTPVGYASRRWNLAHLFYSL